MSERSMRAVSKAELTRFKDWLLYRGVTVIMETNEWELARFKANGITSVMYQNREGRVKFTGESGSAWSSFKSGDNSHWKIEGIAKKRMQATDVMREALLKRDGHNCFFCGKVMEEDDRTLEHLVPASRGGCNNIANLVLAHFACNAEAADMDVMDKIRLRESYQQNCFDNKLVICDATSELNEGDNDDEQKSNAC